MSEYFQEGDVVICPTSQSGCITHLEGQEVSVLLRNLEMWHGLVNRLRLPQDDADLNSCPLNVEREVKLEKVSR